MKLTQEQVIAWAREAGFYGSEILGDHEYDVVGLVSDLERFAALVSAAELRRLYEENAELVEALSVIIRGVPDTWDGVKQAKVILNKTKEKNNG